MAWKGSSLWQEHIAEQFILLIEITCMTGPQLPLSCRV